jgi:hypothetical protein
LQPVRSLQQLRGYWLPELRNAVFLTGEVFENKRLEKEQLREIGIKLLEFTVYLFVRKIVN